MNLLCVGDAAVDIYSNHSYPGGCSLNVARHLQRLNTNTPGKIGVMAPVGADEGKSILETTLADSGLQNHLLETKGSTTTCYIEVDEHGERSFPKYDASALEQFEMTAQHLHHFESYNHVLTLLYKESETLFRSLMKLPLQQPLYCDFTDLKDFNSSADVVREFIPQLDLVFCGLEPQEESLLHDLKALSLEFQTTIVATLGSAGSLAYHKGQTLQQSAKPVKQVVDTTGAGDSFLAAFLTAHLHGLALPQCLEQASHYAAQTLQYEGAFR